MVDLADVTGLDDDAHPRPRAFAHEVVVQRRGEQQRRDRSEIGRRVPVGEDDEHGAGLDRRARLGAQRLETLGHRVLSPVDRVEAGEDHGGVCVLHAEVAALDVRDRRELVVVDDRLVEQDVRGVGLRELEQIALSADPGSHARHDVLADRVERRIRHLSEVLVEVVEEQARSLAERCDRGVRAHRTQRFGPGLGHRRDEDSQLFLGIAEGALAAPDRGLRVSDVDAGGQILQSLRAAVYPVGIGVVGGELVLDLCVGDDALGLGVDEEHAARGEAAAGDDLGLGQIDDSDLAGEHHRVLGHHVPGRAQAVAVEDGAGEPAVGEGHTGGTVPGLHEQRMIFVEGPTLLAHARIVLPGLGDHHQHRLRQRSSGGDHELEDGVERRRVGGTGRHDRAQPVEAARGLGHGRDEEFGGELRFPGLHPVAVAAHGVDLAVVSDRAEWLGQLPRREGVRREARVDQCDPRRQPLVVEFCVERGELTGREHPLIGDGRRGQRGKVDARVVEALAHDVGATGEVSVVTGRVALVASEEDLAHPRHGRSGDVAEHTVIVGHIPHRVDAQALLGGDPGDEVVLGFVAGRGAGA